MTGSTCAVAAPHASATASAAQCVRAVSAAERDRVIGAQCQLWAEYQYFPRLCAFADVAWSPAGADYGEFEKRLTSHLRRLDALGVNYRPLTGPTPGQVRRWPDRAADDLG